MIGFVAYMLWLTLVSGAVGALIAGATAERPHPRAAPPPPIIMRGIQPETRPDPLRPPGGYRPRGPRVDLDTVTPPQRR